MPALNYKKQFAPLVVSGKKMQMIRSERKRPFRVGDTLYHYTGLRTKQCRNLGISQCHQVDDIEIYADTITVNGEHLDLDEMILLARRDGFGMLHNLYEFFENRMPFRGQIIHWGELVGCP